MLVWVAGDDDPRVCTGLRLVRLGRARRVRTVARLRPPPILLDPHARTPLSRADAGAAVRAGVLVLDCSWNQLAERGGFPRHFGGPEGGPLRRRLPYLLASNPQHFGRVGELNTVEAFGAALYVLGFAPAARAVLDGFRGGEAFFEVNRAALPRFAVAPGPEEIVAAERKLYGGGAETSDEPIRSRPAPNGLTDRSAGPRRRGARR